jgi:hypothetical protein
MKTNFLSCSFHWATVLFAKSLPLMTTAVLAGGGLSFFSTASATDLPTGVLNYLRQRDPGVQVRFDGLVRFSNGERYVPVIPQDPALNADAKQVISVTPEKSPIPDLIEFDNHFFLIRLIQTTSGRLTFAKLENYPIQLKEGLLPQDFVLPENLFIPVELKVILGALPYNPAYTPPKPVAPTTTAASKPTPGKTPAKPGKTTTAHTQAPANLSLEDNQAIDHRGRVGYVFDIPEQKLFAIDPSNGRKQSDVSLNCAPSALQVSPDGKLLFAPCLSSNELVVLDTEANLVKTRVKVGERPDALLYLPHTQQVWISNRFSPYLSVINAIDLLPGERIELPGDAGALALFPTNSPSASGKSGPPSKNPLEVAVADATQANIYILNQETRQVARTLPALPDISAMTVLDHGDNHRELWAASRTEGRVMVLDAVTGAVLGKFDVGRKPVALTAYGNKLFVLCAGDAQVNVIDTVRKLALPSIPLEENSFPSGLMAFPASARAYISAAGADQLAVLNLKESRIETTIPVDFRASLIAFTPDPPEQASQSATPPSAGSPSLDVPTSKPTSLEMPASTPAAAESKSTPAVEPVDQPTSPTAVKSVAKPVAQPAATKPEPLSVPVEAKPIKSKATKETEKEPPTKDVQQESAQKETATDATAQPEKAPKRFRLFRGFKGSRNAKAPQPLEMRPLPEKPIPAIAAPATEETETAPAQHPAAVDSAPRLPIPFLPNATGVLLPEAPASEASGVQPSAPSAVSPPDAAKSRLLSNPAQPVHSQQVYKAPSKKAGKTAPTNKKPTAAKAKTVSKPDSPAVESKSESPTSATKTVPAWKKTVKPAKPKQPVTKETTKSKAATTKQTTATVKKWTPAAKAKVAPSKVKATGASSKIDKTKKATPAAAAKTPAKKPSETTHSAKKSLPTPAETGAPAAHQDSAFKPAETTKPAKTARQSHSTDKTAGSSNGHTVAHPAMKPVAKPVELPPAPDSVDTTSPAQ